MTTVGNNAFHIVLDLARHSTQTSDARRTLKAVEQPVSHTNGTSFPVKVTKGIATSAKFGIKRR